MAARPQAASEIQRAFPLFRGFARYAMGINHRRPYIGMAEHFLDRADVVVSLQQVRGKRMAESVG